MVLSLKWFLRELNESRPSGDAYEYGSGNTLAGVPSRPSMNHLRRRGQGTNNNSKISNETTIDADDMGINVDNQKTLFGMWDGVFVRCLLNIFGVIMFLRLGWMVSFGGVIVTMLIVVLSSSITFITALSLSAICTNGKIAGGGAYYLISRALGPEFGGSIGVLLYLATSTSVSMYLLGFAETVVSLAGEEIISSGWDERLLAFFTLCFCMLVCLIGVSWVVKVEKFLLVILLGAIVAFVLGAVTGPVPGASKAVLPFAVRNMGPKWSGETPWNLEEVFTANTSGACSQSASDELRDLYGTVDFGVLLAVFFPAVCGILAGANISGDLKDPSTAIPNGTLLAIVFTTIVYVFLSAIVGFMGARTSIESSEPIGQSSLLDCEYGGLAFNYLMMAESSLYPPLVYAGIFSATVSSALGAFVGAPRILQSLARDRLFSALTPLGKGYGKNDEPLRAYAATFLIAFVCILTGDLNSIAPLITTFFLASYALVNYACFAADTARAPGWRPSFEYFAPWLALSGAVACVAAMLMLSAIMGFITFVLGLGLYKYIEVTNRGAAAAMSQWGPAREAEQYNAALRSMLALESKEHVEQLAHYGEDSKDPTAAPPGMIHPSHVALSDGSVSADVTHVKNFRPQVLVLAGAVEDRPALAIFAAGLRRARGMTLFGDVICGDLSDAKVLELRQARITRSYLSEFGIKGFNEVIVAKSVRDGCRSLLQLGGIGRTMRPNTLLLGFLDSWRAQANEIKAAQHAQHDEENEDSVIVGSTDEDNVRRSGRDSSNKQRNGRRLSTQQGGRNLHNPRMSIEEYVGIIGDACDLGLGVCVLRGEGKLLSREHLHEVADLAKRSIRLGSSLGQTRETAEGGVTVVTSSAAGSGHSDGLVEVNLQDTSNLGSGGLGLSEGDELEEIDVGEEEPITHKPGYGVALLRVLNPFSNSPSNSRPRGTSAGQQSGGQIGDIEMQHATPMHGAVTNGFGQQAVARVPTVVRKRIDVWWIVDDGGLTIMIPHVLRMAKAPPFAGCHLRVMAVGATEEEVREEEQQMCSLLGKLRIRAEVCRCKLPFDDKDDEDFEAAAVLADGGAMMGGVGEQHEDGPADSGGENEWVGGNGTSRLQRHQSARVRSDTLKQGVLRERMYKEIGNELKTHSADALLAVVSLPVPPVDVVPEAYMEWLDLMSVQSERPVLFVRGSQREVVTVHG